MKLNIIKIFFLILLIPNLVFSQENSFLPEIVGIQYRFGVSHNWTRVSKSNETLVDSFYGTGLQGKYLFPINIAFKETSGNFWYYKAFFEFTSPQEQLNIPPYEKDRINLAKKNNENTVLLPITEERKEVVLKALSDKYSSFFASNSEWSLSADFKGQHAYFGYGAGLFIPIGKHRIFKIGLGPAIGYSDFKATTKLCQNYILDVSSYPQIPLEDIFQGNNVEGECIGEIIVDEIELKGPQIALAVNLDIYEFIGDDFSLSILGIDQIGIDRNSDLFSYRSGMETVKIISYISFF